MDAMNVDIAIPHEDGSGAAGKSEGTDLNSGHEDANANGNDPNDGKIVIPSSVSLMFMLSDPTCCMI